MQRFSIRNFGSCLAFDGSSKYITVPSQADLNFDKNAAFTIMWWMKPTTLNARRHYIFNKFNEGVSGYAVYMDTLVNGFNTIYFEERVNYTNANFYQFPLRNNNWTHFALIYNNIANAQAMSLYVNTTLINSSNGLNYSGMVNDTASNLIISKSGTTNSIIGSMDEIQYYNAALTLANIQDNYYRGKIALNNKLLLHLDENTGVAAADASANANNGVITNPAWSTDVFMKPRIAI